MKNSAHTKKNLKKKIKASKKSAKAVNKKIKTKMVTNKTTAKIRHKVVVAGKKSEAKAKIASHKIRNAEKKAGSKTKITKVSKKQQSTRRKKVVVSIPTQKEVNIALDMLMKNKFATEYLQKNVSKDVMEVINLLNTPRTDEHISLQLEMKINSVRRILNIMQGYGITNYYISKNTNGWLSFAWYINTNKINSFFDYINSIKKEEITVTEDCNDYFVCDKCYDKDKLIFQFDAAFESGFKCSICGSKFKRINKEDAKKLAFGKDSSEEKIYNKI